VGATEERSIVIPGYELLEKVGEGGTGTVYRARQVSLQRVVAVKVLGARADGGGKMRAFLWETRLLASLSHPHVLAIHDCAESEGQYYLVTEFVPGTSLRALMQPGQAWPIPRALALLDKVAGALSYIHRHGILHLDLKPENVLCTPEGEIKIADFGLAQPQAEARVLVEQDQVQGTLDYCSLEQRHGLPADERSDLYSLAVLSYELLTGHIPGRAYEKASSLNPELPAAVDEVLRRGLARRQEHRQATIEQFRCELISSLQPRRHRLWTALLTAAALVALTTFFVARIALRATGLKGSMPNAWLIGDYPETFSALAEMTGGLPHRIVNVHVGTRHPEGESELPLPCLPSPRPVLFARSAEGDGFIHPLLALDAVREMLLAWPAPVKAPAVAPEDNFVLAGDFGGRRIWQKEHNGPWARSVETEWKDGEGIDVAHPPDRPENPSLLLDKSGSSVASPLVCYQWIPRTPEAAGAVMVLRYRARAESGTGRLSVGPTLPLVLPNDDHSPIAEELRKRTFPHLYYPKRPGAEVREYRLLDWVRPTSEWRTYCMIWEWPPYCTEAGARNVMIEYQGLGKVWLDDVELFVWRGTKR
jgi:serine/threonine protein kinase